MGVSYNDMMLTPKWVIEEDLEIIAMENKYGKPTEQKESNSGSIR